MTLRALVFSALFLVGSASLLSACGQKGNLYLPEKSTTEPSSSESKQ